MYPALDFDFEPMHMRFEEPCALGALPVRETSDLDPCRTFHDGEFVYIRIHSPRNDGLCLCLEPR